jgi:transmembrane sensor
VAGSFLNVIEMDNRNINMSEREEIVALIDKCLKGDANDNELKRLEGWISASDENRNYYFQIKNIRDIALNGLNPKDVFIEDAKIKVEKCISNKSRISISFNYLQKVAAFLLIPLLAGSFFIGRSLSINKIENLQKPVFNEVSAAFGTRSAITLSDGSKVWLNAGSRFKYPDRFSSNSREVYLWGEAYFEVESNPSKPFIVRTRTMDVRATGTQFNVSTINLTNTFEVTLVSGKVTVSHTIPGEKPEKISEMAPNQHLSYDSISGKIDISKEEIYKYIAWKDGKLVFRNDLLSDVLKKISYFYNVDIELRGDELREYRYRATFEEETISEILKLLKLSAPVDYVELPRKLMPDGTFSKKKIIIYPVNEKI